jgi:hypothetical protein
VTLIRSTESAVIEGYVLVYILNELIESSLLILIDPIPTYILVIAEKLEYLPKPTPILHRQRHCGVPGLPEGLDTVFDVHISSITVEKSCTSTIIA